MKRVAAMIAGWLVGMLGVAILLGILTLGGIAYTITNPSASGGYEDGLGRPLMLAPVWARMFLFAERFWAGAFWKIADIGILIGGLVVFILCVATCAKLIHAGRNPARGCRCPK